MLNYTAEKLAKILDAKLIGNSHENVSEIFIDSRTYHLTPSKAFVAIVGKRNNGHDYIEELYENEIRIFIISEFREEYQKLNEATFLLCKDTVVALHKLALHKRKSFKGKLIAITGSNGKTYVKEWLFYLLNYKHQIIRSPKSYNSQVGVALSLLLLDNNYDIAIIEAGISMPGEMQKLQQIIQPDAGIFTGLGEAHSENFESQTQKLKEKIMLFKNSKFIIANSHDAETLATIKQDLPKTKIYTWGISQNDTLYIRFANYEKGTNIDLSHQNHTCKFFMQQQDLASRINIGHCLAYLVAENLIDEVPADAIANLPNIEMRLEQINGINNCTLINDAYNSDINSLAIALDLLKKQALQKQKTLIISDIKQTSHNNELLYHQIAEMTYNAGITRLIGIGAEISKHKQYFDRFQETKFYPDTSKFLAEFSNKTFYNEAILLKGARCFKFEQIINKLQEKKHQTRLEINLNAIIHNLNYFKAKLQSHTQIMAIVKASSYGSGTHEVVNMLDNQNINYLATALTDEGIQLRKEGIRLPIMIMNPEPTSIDSLIEYNLEPEIYSFESLAMFSKKTYMLTNRQYGIHLKINTGMNRLGFDENEIPQLIRQLKNNKVLKIRSIFSHLAAADEPQHDDFTRQQIAKFKRISDKIQDEFPYKILRHIANSAGILRFPEAHFDMVRLGIGLYGLSIKQNKHLQNSSTLISHISQVRDLSTSDTVGYSRKGKISQKSRVAIVPIGYADGLNRRLSNGNWAFIVNGKKAPILGNICMDMSMIDVTNIDAKAGDEVIIFGDAQTADQMATKLETISYEIITNIGERVKRVYYH